MRSFFVMIFVMFFMMFFNAIESRPCSTNFIYGLLPESTLKLTIKLIP